MYDYSDPRYKNKNMKLVLLTRLEPSDITIGLHNSDFVYNFIVDIEGIEDIDRNSIQITMIKDGTLHTASWPKKTKVFILKKD